MANAKDISIDNPIPKILLFGDSGTHKTFFAAGCPNVHVFDFDGGMAIVRGMDVEYTTIKDAPKGFTVREDRGTYAWGTGWEQFIKKLNVIGERIDEGEFIPIAIDSLTTLSNLAMNYIKKQDGRRQQDPIRIQDWGGQTQLLEVVMDQLTSWPVPLIVTAHVQRNTNDLTETIEMLPLLTGKFAGKVGLYFDEVYYTTVSGKGDKKKFVLQTESYGLVKQAKTRYNVKDGTETNWESVISQIAA